MLKVGELVRYDEKFLNNIKMFNPPMDETWRGIIKDYTRYYDSNKLLCIVYTVQWDHDFISQVFDGNITSCKKQLSLI